MLPGEFRDRVRESSRIIHRRQDFESFSRRGLRIMIKNQEVVFHTVAWSDVHAACSLFQRDKIREQDRREPSGHRPFSLQPLEPLAPSPYAQHTITMQTA